MGIVSIPGVKRPGRGVNHPPPSSAEVKERIELYMYSPSGPLWLVLRQTLPFYLLPFIFSIEDIQLVLETKKRYIILTVKPLQKGVWEMSVDIIAVLK